MVEGTCCTCRFFAPDTRTEEKDGVKTVIEEETGGCHYNPPKEYLLAPSHPSRPPVVLGVWPRVNSRLGWCRVYERDPNRLPTVAQPEEVKEPSRLIV
jgi:hypothetical protein